MTLLVRIIGVRVRVRATIDVAIEYDRQ